MLPEAVPLVSIKEALTKTLSAGLTTTASFKRVSHEALDILDLSLHAWSANTVDWGIGSGGPLLAMIYITGDNVF
jgi:hypothetical protein